MAEQAGRLRTDFGAGHARMIMPAGPPAHRSFYSLEKPAVADCERPFPDLPPAGRTVRREEQELRLADEILRRDIPDGRQHAAVLRIVTVVAHRKVVVRRYCIDRCIVERTVVADLDDP